MICQTRCISSSFLAQLVERVTSNDEVSRSSRLEGNFRSFRYFLFSICLIWTDIQIASSKAFHFVRSRRQALLCEPRLETGKIITRSFASRSSRLVCFYRRNSLHYQWQKTVTKNVDVIRPFFSPRNSESIENTPNRISLGSPLQVRSTSPSFVGYIEVTTV